MRDVRSVWICLVWLRVLYDGCQNVEAYQATGAACLEKANDELPVVVSFAVFTSLLSVYRCDRSSLALVNWSHRSLNRCVMDSEKLPLYELSSVLARTVGVHSNMCAVCCSYQKWWHVVALY